MKSDQSLTIIMPAYNEEARIGRTLDAYLGFYNATQFPRTEVIVILNGCRDNSAQVARQFQQQHPNLRVIDEPRAIGKGGAVMLGFREAKGELIGYVDADNSTSPKEFQKLVDAIDGGDVIIGSRWIKGAIVHPRQPLSRRVASRIFNLLVRTLFGVAVWDTQCGAKTFRSEVIRAVLPSLGITRWAFDVDVLFQCRRHGYNIREVPTVWSDSSGSRLQVVRASWEMLAAIIRLRLIYSPFRFVVRLYDLTFGPLFHSKTGS